MLCFNFTLGTIGIFYVSKVFLLHFTYVYLYSVYLNFQSRAAYFLQVLGVFTLYYNKMIKGEVSWGICQTVSGQNCAIIPLKLLRLLIQEQARKIIEKKSTIWFLKEEQKIYNPS